jgi:hypothetical protein
MYGSHVKQMLAIPQSGLGLDALLLNNQPENGRVPLHQFHADLRSGSIETLEKMMAELQRMRALQASTLDIS